MQENQKLPKSKDPLFAPPSKEEMSMVKNDLFAPPTDDELRADAPVLNEGMISGELPSGVRAKLSFASGGQERRGFLQKEYPGIQFGRMIPSGKTDDDAVEVVKLPNGQWTYIDSPAVTMGDVADWAGDVPAMALGAGAGLLAAPTGPGSVAAAGAGAAGGEVLRKMIGRGLLGIPNKQSLGQDVVDVGIAGGTGAGAQFGLNKIGGFISKKLGERAAKKTAQAVPKEGVEQVATQQAAPEPGLLTSSPELAPEGAEMLKKGLIEDSGQRAARIQKAGGLLDVTPTKGMMSEDPIIRGLESSLEQSPSAAGMLVRRQTGKAREGMQSAVEQFTNARTPKTAEQIGDSVKEGIKTKILQRYEPIQKAYREIEESAVDILVADKSKKSVARNLRNYAKDDLVSGTPEAQLVDNVAQKLETVKSVNQLKQLRTYLQKKVRSSKPDEAYALGPVVQKLDRMIENNIMREAIKTARTKGEGAEIGRGLIKNLKEANKGYRGLKEDLSYFGKKSGVSRSNYVYEFLDDIDNMSSSQLGDKLFKSGDLKFLNYVKREFPAEFDKVRQYKIKELYDESLDGERINPKKFLKAIDKYEPEVRRLLFGDNYRGKISTDQALDALRTLVNSWPEKMGPSGTPQGQQFIEALNPILQLKEGARYGVYAGKPIPKNLSPAEIAKKAKLKGARGGVSKGLIGTEAAQGASRLAEGD